MDEAICEAMLEEAGGVGARLDFEGFVRVVEGALARTRGRTTARDQELEVGRQRRDSADEARALRKLLRTQLRPQRLGPATPARC